jgi:type IV pilus assembly protein PilO
MKNVKFGNRELVFTVVMLGLLAGSYFLGFAKQNERRLAKQADIDSRRRSLAQLQEATAGVGDVEKKIDELQRATSVFEAKLPHAKEIDTILRELWQLAESRNLTTKTVRTLASHRLNGYSEQPIEMSLSGDFNGFYEFLLHLEKLPRLNRVTHMYLTKINEHDGEMQAQMTLSIYFAPDSDLPPGQIVAATH